MMEDIINTHEKLNKELRIALATMERSNKIFDIKKQIIQNQTRCPHFSTQYNWAIIDGVCPYCGYKISGE